MAHLATLFQACTGVKQVDVCSYELQSLAPTSRRRPDLGDLARCSCELQQIRAAIGFSGSRALSERTRRGITSPCSHFIHFLNSSDHSSTSVLRNQRTLPLDARPAPSARHPPPSAARALTLDATRTAGEPAALREA